MNAFMQKMQTEREYQKSRNWGDEHNTAGMWCMYIANYMTRFAMPMSFDKSKYNFGTCMVKAATLCMAAYEWWESRGGDTDAETVPAKVSANATPEQDSLF